MHFSIQAKSVPWPHSRLGCRLLCILVKQSNCLTVSCSCEGAQTCCGICICADILDLTRQVTLLEQWGWTESFPRLKNSVVILDTILQIWHFYAEKGVRGRKKMQGNPVSCLPSSSHRKSIESSGVKQVTGTCISETQGRWGSISTHKVSIGLTTAPKPAQAYLWGSLNSLKLGTCASISSSLPKVVQTFLHRMIISRVKLSIPPLFPFLRSG